MKQAPLCRRVQTRGKLSSHSWLHRTLLQSLSSNSQVPIPAHGHLCKPLLCSFVALQVQDGSRQVTSSTAEISNITEPCCQPSPCQAKQVINTRANSVKGSSESLGESHLPDSSNQCSPNISLSSEATSNNLREETARKRAPGSPHLTPLFKHVPQKQDPKSTVGFPYQFCSKSY